ncbi:MAG: hypothetical protein CVU05_12440 [Bacteroidetes bacterium HGW-Bacteroidetes-21]|nr:MAG: hypothetical protein CVU05_12440 [Bacteroidetes bacterium HGW-Bacteroidetes-21]
MKIFLLIIVIISSCITSVYAQAPRFQKYSINDTGYSAYFPADPGTFENQKSDDGLNIYTGEVIVDNTNYAIILVLLEDTYKDAPASEIELLITSYLDFIQEQFGINASAGYGKGHTLESHPEAVGVIDYWEDTNGNNYSVKAWADQKALAVMMVYSKEEINYNYQTLYLNGFRFKE